MQHVLLQTATHGDNHHGCIGCLIKVLAVNLFLFTLFMVSFLDIA
jgi:hypothetical protein